MSWWKSSKVTQIGSPTPRCVTPHIHAMGCDVSLRRIWACSPSGHFLSALTRWRCDAFHHPSKRGFEQRKKKEGKEEEEEEAHINIGESPASYKKCSVQSKLKVSMQNFNARWRAGPFEVDRWMPRHELNIKGSIRTSGSLSFGGCKGGMNRFLWRAGGRAAQPQPSLLSPDTHRQRARRQTAGPALRKCLLFLKKIPPALPAPDAAKSEMYAAWI